MPKYRDYHLAKRQGRCPGCHSRWLGETVYCDRCSVKRARKARELRLRIKAAGQVEPPPPERSAVRGLMALREHRRDR